ncbi:hypothetical protein RQP46_010097 [Phenoliferia psychrophenolica]
MGTQMYDSREHFAISPYCFKEITISYGGKSAQAQIVDACEACGYGGIDLSPSLFSFFASQSVGIIYLEASLAKVASNIATALNSTSISSTHDSSSVGTNSTLASSQGVSSVASLTIGTTSTTSDSPAAPPTDQVGGNLDGLHQLVIQMGGMVAAAAQAQNA